MLRRSCAFPIFNNSQWICVTLKSNTYRPTLTHGKFLDTALKYDTMETRSFESMQSMLPPTPSKSAAIANAEIEHIVKALNGNWNLALELPNPQASPDRRPSLERACYSNIKFLCYRSAALPIIEQFESEATALYGGWVSKPKAERGVVPARTRQNPRPVTPSERIQLLGLFISITGDVKKKMIAAGMAGTPRRRLFSSDASRLAINDDPIGISLPVVPRSALRAKRSSEESDGSIKQRKSPKRPRSSEEQTEVATDAFKRPALPSNIPRNIEIFSRVPSESNIPPVSTTTRGIQVSSTSFDRSANTSFASSHQSSIFDKAPQETLPSHTQETVPDLGDSIAPGAQEEPDTQSSDNWAAASILVLLIKFYRRTLLIQALMLSKKTL